MANEGLRPYWYDSSVVDGDKFTLRFYYPADIDSITLLNRISGNEELILLKKEGEYLYIRERNKGCVTRYGIYNDGNTVIYDQRQEKPVYSNRISKR